MKDKKNVLVKRFPSHQKPRPLTTTNCFPFMEQLVNIARFLMMESRVNKGLN